MAVKQACESITTRIDVKAWKVIQKAAAARRTTSAQVARVLLEDAAKTLAADQQAA
jgi:hypothetical protein